MTLDKYWKKRDFHITSEPRGKAVKKSAAEIHAHALSFFIQRHHARRLHYDFRLELNGTLKSWAVPKGPSLNPADKRLAVHVEDHPMEYGTFEGDIPAHQYGAGHVVLWDRGIWIPIGDPEEGYRKGSLKFVLEGEKLQGKWALVRMGKPADEGKENWLLIKEKDEESRTDETANITELRPESVKDKKSGKPKTLGTKAAASTKATSAKTQLHNLDAPMPDFIDPQLATLVTKAPVGNQWLSEVKYDGYRALSRVDNSSRHQKVVVYTRAGNDWTGKWPVIAEALTALAVDQAWLDGEVVALDEDGNISFQALQNYHSDKHPRSAKNNTRLIYYVFDLLYLNGQDISTLPQIDRKALLKEVLSTLPQDAPIMFSDHIAGNAQAVFENACNSGLEGIVVKQADAPYSQARTQSWQKVKCVTEQEFVVGGYTDPEGSRTGFGALVLGVYDKQGKLIYSGRVGTGFNNANIPVISKKLVALETDNPAFDKPPKGQDARGVHWVKPELVAEVKFAQWTDANVIRHASFVALREDKPPQEVIHEHALSKAEVAAAAKSKAASKAKSRAASKADARPAVTAKDEASVAGVRISHASKVIFSERQETKLDLALYYENIEDWLMPHLIDRPLALLRCPQGNEKECFFQKNYNDSSPEQVQKIKVPSSDGSTYMMANDLQAVIGLVQMGVLELHTWGSRKGSLNKPDRITMDLDPDPQLPWPKVIEAAQLVKFLFESIDLKSFIKTTGGKGLHIVVPIKPELDFAEIKAFSKSIAEHLSTTLPDYFTSVMSKTKRTNKIFLDYLRNGVDATAVAAYSTRARPDASVSMPILWEELTPELHADAFNLANVRDRLAALKQDPWADYYATHQRITKKMVGIFT